MEFENQRLAKIIILGDSNVGKSSILMRYTEGKFSPQMMITVGIDYRIKKLTLNN